MAVSKGTDEVKNDQVKKFKFHHQTNINQRNTFSGTWLDPFNGDSPIKLTIEIEFNYCDKLNKSNVLFRIVSEGKSSALTDLNTMKMPKCE